MANEIQVAHSATAKTLYALVRNSVGQVLTVSGLTFGAYATVSLANYKIALTEQGTASRFYAANFPALAAGIYSVSAYEQAGGSAAEGDTLVAGGNIDWAGAVVQSLGVSVPIVAAGVENGLLIAGSNAATTFASFTCTNNFTVSGNWLTTGTTIWTGAVTFSAGLTSAITGNLSGNVGGNVIGSIGSLATQAKADVNAECDTALAEYDAPTNAEMVARTLVTGSYATLANQTLLLTEAARLDTLIELDGLVYRFTSNALEQVAAEASFTDADRTKLETLATDLSTARAANLDNLDVASSDILVALGGINVSFGQDQADLVWQSAERSLTEFDFTVTASITVTGGGSIPVDQDYGGVDTLRVTDNHGNGISGAELRWYLKADYAAGNRGASQITAKAMTGVDGRWTSTVMLEPETYTLLVIKPGAYQAHTVDVTVTP